MKKYFTFSFILKLVVAVILIQTLYFKFTGSPESKYIFETVGMEPWGRIGTGIVELISVMLIFIPRTTWIGAVLALGIVTGAIFFISRNWELRCREMAGCFLFSPVLCLYLA